MPNGGRVLIPDISTAVHRDLIIALATRHRLPAVFLGRGWRSDVLRLVDSFRQAASYVDRILRGDKPADLPVQAATKFETVANLKTAKALGLTVPPMLLAIADEVIECGVRAPESVAVRTQFNRNSCQGFRRREVAD